MPSFSRREIEQTIINLIRERAVAEGYLPDERAYATRGDYEAARAAIIAGGKELVDVFGVGANSMRGEKKYHRIWLNMRQYNPGAVSHWGESGYIQTNDAPVEYAREQVFGSQKTIIYDIRAAVEGLNATEYSRICLDLIMGGLTTSTVGIYIPVLKPDFTYDTDRRFLLRYTGAQEIKGPKFFEHLMTFEVVDVWLDSDTGTSWDTSFPTTGIVPLTTVQVEGGIDGEPPQTIIEIQ